MNSSINIILRLQSRVDLKTFMEYIKKMLSKDLDFNNVFDIKAFRYFTEKESDCYAALGAVHSTWKPIPEDLKIILRYQRVMVTNLYIQMLLDPLAIKLRFRSEQMKCMR